MSRLAASLKRCPDTNLFPNCISTKPRKLIAHSISPAYNRLVVNATRQKDSRHKQRHAAYATETTGLLLIALLILALTVARYWHAIHWSMR